MTKKPSIFYIFYTFLLLGCTAFGGPIAHLAYFNKELIQKKGWLDQAAYTNLMGLCHFIPGPSSSQVGLSIGYLLQGWRGAIAAWLGFTLPSALLMSALAAGMLYQEHVVLGQTIHYLKIIALAVVAQAIWQMSRSMLSTHLMRALCITNCVVILIIPHLFTISVLLIIMGLIGYRFFSPIDIYPTEQAHSPAKTHVHAYRILAIGLLFFVALLVMSSLTTIIDKPLNQTLSEMTQLFASMYRSGALVFGGGHVVLPLVEQEVTQHSHISTDTLLAGYGLVQAMPGPLFTFSTYIGALWIDSSPWLGALIATFAIFLPSFILIPSLLPLWQRLQYNHHAKGVLAGCNITVIGLLISLLYQPLWISTILSASDFAAALTVWALLQYGKCPPWLMVIVAVMIGLLVP